jgi:hypothetical protein
MDADGFVVRAGDALALPAAEAKGSLAFSAQNFLGL